MFFYVALGHPKIAKNRALEGPGVVRVSISGPTLGWAVGSQVRIAVEKKVVTSHVEAGTGQGNQNDRTLHFGLTDHEGPLKLQVHWIDGEAQQVDAEPGKLVVIKRAEKK